MSADDQRAITIDAHFIGVAAGHVRERDVQASAPFLSAIGSEKPDFPVGAAVDAGGGDSIVTSADVQVVDIAAAGELDKTVEAE